MLLFYNVIVFLSFNHTRVGTGKPSFFFSAVSIGNLRCAAFLKATFFVLFAHVSELVRKLPL